MRKFTLFLFIGFLFTNFLVVFGQEVIHLKVCQEFIPRQVLISPYFFQVQPEIFFENRNNLSVLLSAIENGRLNRIHDTEFLIRAAEFFLKKEDYEKAKKIAFSVLSKNQKEARALFIIADTYEYERNLSKALDYYLKAAKINTTMPNIHNNIGYTLWRIDQRNGAEAQKEYELEMKYNPTNWSPYINRALVYRHNGDNEKAFQDYAKAVELGQDEIEPFLIAARFCEQLQVHQREGKEFLRKTLQLYPNSWRAWEIKAGFHYRDKEYKEAERTYLHSLELYERATTLYELSWTYVKMGELDLAKKVYERAQSLNPPEDNCYEETARQYLEEKGVVLK